MHPSAAAVVRLLQDSNLRGVTHSGATWRIDSTSAAAEKLKESVLGTACAKSSPFVHYDDPPPTHGRLASCESVGPGVWRVPQGSPGKELLDWLYMGNWQLYLAGGPLQELQDLARATTEVAESFVHENHISLIIDSFHDDVSWTVVVPHDA
jgi:hypothetical protein